MLQAELGSNLFRSALERKRDWLPEGMLLAGEQSWLPREGTTGQRGNARCSNSPSQRVAANTSDHGRAPTWGRLSLRDAALSLPGASCSENYTSE